MSDTAAPRIILGTSNGVGMGHLARQAAIALALGDRAEPVLFSMSPAVPLVLDMGLRGEYCPNFRRGFLPRWSWDRYFADRLAALAEETGARLIAYDGVVPYHGLLRARLAMPDVAFVWMRPGMWRPGTNAAVLKARRFFDLVIEPGDVAAPADSGATAGLGDAVRVPPVTLYEQVPLLSRAEAAARLGLDPARPAALVTLRSGSGPDDEPASVALRTLLANPDWQVAVTRTPLAAGRVPGSGPARVVLLEGVFPLASYLSAFDAAVVEAGYNAVHEMLYAAVPAVLVPTGAAVTDDQVSRAGWAAENGFALRAAETDPASVGEAVGRLLDPAVRDRLAARCAALPAPGGAAAAAGLLVRLAETYEGHRTSLPERWRLAQGAVRTVGLRLLGRRGGSAARRWLGRAPDDSSTRALSATAPLFAVDRDGAEDLRGRAVEHVLAGASAEYRRARERLARRYYGAWS